MIKANGLHAISLANRQVTTVCCNTNVFHYFPSYLLYNRYNFMLIIYNSFVILSIIILEKSENNYYRKRNAHSLHKFFVSSYWFIRNYGQHSVIKHKNGSNTSDRNESIRTVPLFQTAWMTIFLCSDNTHLLIRLRPLSSLKKENEKQP